MQVNYNKPMATCIMQWHVKLNTSKRVLIEVKSHYSHQLK